METMEKIHGVNLGNWLVLEKWMSPGLFEGVNGEDETDFCDQLPQEELQRRYKQHRDTYITLEDFKYIKNTLGMNSVRIPVPHFVFDDVKPFVGCVDYLDKAFDWAAEVGLTVLIDLHTAPESQNGFDNGGLCGVCKWHQSEERIQRVLYILEELAKRYNSRQNLMGIQLLNEPVSEEVWLAARQKYIPVDPARAAGSTAVPLDTLFDFYTRGVEMMRRHLKPEQKVVLHDGFRFRSMAEFLGRANFPGVVMDAHFYLGMGTDPMHEAFDVNNNVEYVLKNLSARLRFGQTKCPVIVGEWCLDHEDIHREGKSDFAKMLAYRIIADAQLTAWQECAGHYFWSYKLPSDPPGWDVRKCVERGWFPAKY